MSRSKHTNIYRSGLEQRIAHDLERRGVTFAYETLKIPYQKKPSVYNPDFILPNSIIIEAKGRLTTADRVKMLLVKEQHPYLDIRFVFQRAHNKIRKGSKTTYAMWCDRHGFPWAEKLIPLRWIRESSKGRTLDKQTNPKKDTK